MKRKTNQTEPEVLNFSSKKEADYFMQAVNTVEKQSYISNNSIIRKDDFTVEIYDTKAMFLLNCGREYYKLTKL